VGKEVSVCFVGTGGQGILFAATALANALFSSGYDVAQLQCYGAEVRGGSVLAYVIFSDEEIKNPFIENFDYLLMLSDIDVKEWQDLVKSSRVVIADEELVKNPPPHAIRLPMVRTAIEGGVSGRENIVALGCLAGMGIIGLDVIEKVLAGGLDAERNIKALRLGYELWLKQGRKLDEGLKQQRS